MHNQLRAIPHCRRMLEVVFFAVLTTSLWFWLSYASPCVDNPKFDKEACDTGDHLGPFDNGDFKVRVGRGGCA